MCCFLLRDILKIKFEGLNLMCCCAKPNKYYQYICEIGSVKFDRGGAALKKKKFEVFARTHIKLASIFCGAGRENRNYFDILQIVLSLYVIEQFSIRVSTVLPIQSQNWQIDQFSLIVAGQLNF